ncbi:MAG: allantoinase AllB [Bacteroidota bacterium]
MSDSIHLASKNVLLPEGVKPATLVINNGVISSILPERVASTKAQPVRDYGDALIMPGVIDCNVCIHEPGHEDWEGFEFATAAAVAGGITTIIDLPLNNIPPTTVLAALDEKIMLAQGRIAVNCGFWAGINIKEREQIAQLADAGVMGFYATLENSDATVLPALTLDELKKIAPDVAATGLPLLVQPRISARQKKNALKLKDRYSYEDFLAKFPDEIESDSIEKIIDLLKKHHLKLHITEISCSESLKLLSESRTSGIIFSAGTSPHHLYFSSDTIPDQDPRFKNEPPIRSLENNKSMLEALASELIDIVYSSHRPCPAEMKDLHAGDIEGSVSGISSLQFLLPIMWSIAERKKITLEKFADLMCRRPAEFLGLKNKGRLATGYDADLVIWNPTKKMKVNSNTIRSRHKVTAYEGQMLSGVVQETWVNGQLAYDRGAFPVTSAGQILRSSY